MTIDFSDMDDLAAAETATTKAATWLEASTKIDNRPRERCRKCGGTGQYRGYSSYGQQCFACGGTGKGRLCDPKSVAARTGAQKRKDAKAAAKIAADASWREEHTDVCEFIASKAGKWDFMASMSQALMRYGTLTERQVAAVRKCIAADTDRREAKRKEELRTSVNVVGAGLEKLVAVFKRAHAAGLRKPKLRVDTLEFSRAQDSGRNAGAIYVVSNADGYGRYQGKIVDGHFVPLRDALPGVAERVAAIGADPLAEAIASGKRNGVCACCGRELTDPESVARGIGPICAEKFFGG